MSEALTLSSVRLGTSIDLQAEPWETMNVRFPEPRQRVTSREFADKDGAEIIDVQYDNSMRTIVVDLRAEDKDNALANVRSLETMLNAPDLLIEYTPNGSASTSFSRALVNEKATEIDFVWSNSSVAHIVMKITCEPFWHGTTETIEAQTLNPTPQKITLGNVKGDVKMPCTIEIEGDDSFGTNIRIGSRENPMSESLFNPIKDFQGSTLAGAYNGKASDLAVTDSWTNLTGESTNLNGVAMEDASNGVAVGDGGKIFTTDDAWITNSDISHGLTSQDLQNVTWAGGTTYYACGDAGVILKSTDSGANWTALTSGVGADLYGIDFITTTEGYAVGDTGTVVVTTDGSAWTDKTSASGTTDDLRGVSTPAAGTAFAGGGNEVIKTSDTGASWANENPSAMSNIQDIDFYDSNTGAVVGPGATSPSSIVSLRTTSNGAAPWSAAGAIGVTIDADEDFRSIDMQSATVGWMLGAGGLIYTTDDLWATATKQVSGTPANLNGVAAVDANNVFVVGTGFTILTTDDGGATWVQPTAAFSLTLEYAGRYDVHARIKKSASGAGDMRVSSGWAGGSVITNPSVPVAEVDTLQTVYLGEIAIPATNVSPEAGPTPIVKVEGILDAGSETWSSDVFWLTPVDGEATEIEATATDSAHIIIDSDKNAVNKGSTIVTWIGVPIFLRPGDNNIVISETAGIGGAIITVKYEPLYKLPVA